MPTDKLERIGNILRMADGLLTREEFLKLLQPLLVLMQNIKTGNEREFTLMRSALQILQQKMEAEMATEMDGGKKDMMSYCMKEISKMMKDHENEMKFIYDKVSRIEDGRDADKTKIVQDVLAQIQLPEQKEIILDTPIELRDKLETLQEPEKLIISAIRGLREELDALKSSKGGASHAIFASQRGAVKAYDLTASLNGVLKTFSLPSFWRVISVHSSSFPNAFREATDYTTDASASTITFTSEIDASTALASGNSIIIIYAEP